MRAGKGLHLAAQPLLLLALLAADQASKYWAAGTLRQNGPARLWPGVLELVYAENTGAAFGSFTGMGTVLAVVNLLLMALIALLYLRILRERKWLPLQYTAMVLLAGGLGNVVDRFTRGFVVDFIYFVPINFPVFNLADCCIVASVLALFVLVLFKYNEDELWQIVKKRK